MRRCEGAFAHMGGMRDEKRRARLERGDAIYNASSMGSVFRTHNFEGLGDVQSKMGHVSRARCKSVAL